MRPPHQKYLTRDGSPVSDLGWWPSTSRLPGVRHCIAARPAPGPASLSLYTIPAKRRVFPKGPAPGQAPAGH